MTRPGPRPTASCHASPARRDASDINFLTQDSLKGRCTSNDCMLVCGSPNFGKDPGDPIELNRSPPGWVLLRAGARPDFQGSSIIRAASCRCPSRTPTLATLPTPTTVHAARPRSPDQGSTMNVTNGGARSKPLPPSGVVYVQELGCPAGYSRKQEYAAAPDCGNVYVSGTYNKDMTIGADNDIIITEDFKSRERSSDAGRADREQLRARLSPGEQLEQQRPRLRQQRRPRETSTIDAAILALNHSFIVDNWYCGNPTGTLTVTGAIAQKFRGTVGTFSRQQHRQRLREELQLQRHAEVPRAAVLRRAPPSRPGAWSARTSRSRRARPGSRAARRPAARAPLSEAPWP